MSMTAASSATFPRSLPTSLHFSPPQRQQSRTATLKGVQVGRGDSNINNSNASKYHKTSSTPSQVLDLLNHPKFSRSRSSQTATTTAAAFAATAVAAPFVSNLDVIDTTGPRSQRRVQPNTTTSEYTDETAGMGRQRQGEARSKMKSQAVASRSGGEDDNGDRQTCSTSQEHHTFVSGDPDLSNVISMTSTGELQHQQRQHCEVSDGGRRPHTRSDEAWRDKSRAGGLSEVGTATTTDLGRTHTQKSELSDQRRTGGAVTRGEAKTGGSAQQVRHPTPQQGRKCPPYSTSNATADEFYTRTNPRLKQNSADTKRGNADTEKGVSGTVRRLPPMPLPENQGGASYRSVKTQPLGDTFCREFSDKNMWAEELSTNENLSPQETRQTYNTSSSAHYQSQQSQPNLLMSNPTLRSSRSKNGPEGSSGATNKDGYDGLFAESGFTKKCGEQSVTLPQPRRSSSLHRPNRLSSDPVPPASTRCGPPVTAEDSPAAIEGRGGATNLPVGAVGSASARTNSADRPAGTSGSGGGTPVFSDAHRKLQNFKQAREIGKTVCVCGASAYWERERVAIAQERSRLKQEGEAVREEWSALRSERQKLNARSVEIESNESQIAQREKKVMRQEESLKVESVKLSDQSSRLRRERDELEAAEQQLQEREMEVDLKTKKVQKDAQQIELQAEKIAKDSKKLSDDKLRYRGWEAELSERRRAAAELSASLEDEVNNVKADRESLEATRADLERREAQLQSEETRLHRWQSQLADKEAQINLEASHIESVKLFNAKLEETLSKQAEDITHQKQALEADKVAFEEEKQATEAAHTAASKELADLRVEMDREGFQIRAEKMRTLADIEDAKNALEEDKARLATSRAENAATEEALWRRQHDLDEREESLKEQELKLQEEISGIESDSQTLQREREDLESLRRELEDREESLQRRAQDVEKESRRAEELSEAATLKEKELSAKQQSLAEREKKVSEREAGAASRESRSEFRQTMQREIQDITEKYQLQLREVEWDRMESQKLLVEARLEAERQMSAIKVKKEQLESWEQSLQSRSREVKRSERLLETRLAEEGSTLQQKLLTVKAHPVPSSPHHQPTGTMPSMGDATRSYSHRGPERVPALSPEQNGGLPASSVSAQSSPVRHSRNVTRSGGPRRSSTTSIKSSSETSMRLNLPSRDGDASHSQSKGDGIDPTPSHADSRRSSRGPHRRTTGGKSTRNSSNGKVKQKREKAADGTPDKNSVENEEKNRTESGMGSGDQDVSSHAEGDAGGEPVATSGDGGEAEPRGDASGNTRSATGGHSTGGSVFSQEPFTDENQEPFSAFSNIKTQVAAENDGSNRRWFDTYTLSPMSSNLTTLQGTGYQGTLLEDVHGDFPDQKYKALLQRGDSPASGSYLTSAATRCLGAPQSSGTASTKLAALQQQQQQALETSTASMYLRDPDSPLILSNTGTSTRQ